MSGFILECLRNQYYLCYLKKERNICSSSYKFKIYEVLHHHIPYVKRHIKLIKCRKLFTNICISHIKIRCKMIKLEMHVILFLSASYSSVKKNTSKIKYNCRKSKKLITSSKLAISYIMYAHGKSSRNG